VATPRIADQIGRVLGRRYRLVAPIGTGASAHVYVADDVELRRRVAVKVLHPALAEDESFLRRFRAEAQAVAGLRHPHIMQVYDWGQDLDGPFLVLEHLAGGSLRDLLDGGHRLSISQALNVGLEAARGLDYAHRRGLVHRDIKPANLLFDEEGRLSIADFGLARALAEAAWTEPAGAVLGTARYASPEQARGSRVDGKADVYALALTMVEAVTGRVPFASDTTIATLMARVDRPLEVPEELGPLVPVLAEAGVADPAGRLDAGELARQLEAAAADLPRPRPLPLADPVPPTAIDLRRPADHDDLTFIGDAPTTTTAATTATGASGAAAVTAGGGPRLFDVEAVPPPAEPEGRRRRRWPILLAILLALAALAGGGAALAGAMKPSFPVPDLTGRTLADARRLAGGEQDFAVVAITEDRYDEEAPKGTIVGQAPAPEAERKQGSTIRVHVSDGPRPRQVPDLTGLTRGQAQAALDAQGLPLTPKDTFDESVPKDVVVDWSPKGTTVERGSAVTVTFSKGPEPKALPGFLDKVYDEYVKLLEGLGIKAKKEEAFSDKVEEGKVIGTEPAGPVTPGSEVTVIVSKGPEQVAVPNVSGLSEEDAAAKLEAAGLRLGDRYGPAKRKVFATRPGAGAMVDKGSSVDVYTG
jgi:serine/threonine-protein kinase